MTPTGSEGHDLHATVSARRDLGPEYDDALVEGFLEKLDSGIEQRIDARLAGKPREAPKPAPTPSPALSIFSLIAGVIGTQSVHDQGLAMVVVLWLGIVAVNVAYMLGQRRG